MLAAIFIQGGIAALRYPQSHVQAAKPVLDAVKPVLEQATDAAAPTVDKAAAAVPVDLPPDRPTDWSGGAAAARERGMERLAARLEKLAA